MLARAFGLYPQNRRAYTGSGMGEKVQPYARDAVSALAEVGCVTGYDTGYLKPRDPISRQEVAALFYKLLDQILRRSPGAAGDRLRPLPGHGPLPQGYRLEGSLVLGAGLSGSQTVTGNPGDRPADSPVRHRHGADPGGGIRRGGVRGLLPHGDG